jgi:hypothetical protein
LNFDAEWELLDLNSSSRFQCGGSPWINWELNIRSENEVSSQNGVQSIFYQLEHGVLETIPRQNIQTDLYVKKFVQKIKKNM